jgi:hypothetical protein
VYAWQNGLPDSGKVASIPAMKTSSKIPRGFMILAAIVVPALSWWGSWRYQAAKEADEARIKAERKHAEEKQRIAQWLKQHQQRQMKDVFAEWKKSSDDISKRLTELEKSRQSVEKGENKDGSLPRQSQARCDQTAVGGVKAKAGGASQETGSRFP